MATPVQLMKTQMDNVRNYAFTFFLQCGTTFTSPRLCWLSCLYAKTRFQNVYADTYFCIMHMKLQLSKRQSAPTPCHFPFH